MPIILLTDFGNKDPYVGIIKGVISKIAPQVSVLDLTHEIEPFNIDEAAFVLYQSYSYFPKGSIFLTAVDPGVGSACRRVLVKTTNYFFIGPDNGYLSMVLTREKMEHTIHLTHKSYFLKQTSSTFHGRDIFAPVAAQLAEGIDIHEFGSELYDLDIREALIPKVKKKSIQGKILSMDRFGNAITNISREFVEKGFLKSKFFLSIKNKKIQKFSDYYSQSTSKAPFLIYGSSGFLEIAVNQGSAAKVLKLKKSDLVVLRKSGKP